MSSAETSSSPRYMEFPKVEDSEVSDSEVHDDKEKITSLANSDRTIFNVRIFFSASTSCLQEMKKLAPLN